MTRPPITRLQFLSYLLCPPLYVMLFLMVSEAVLSASTTYLVIRAGRDVAALKKQAVLRILEVEERHLPTCATMTAELRAALAKTSARIKRQERRKRSNPRQAAPRPVNYNNRERHGRHPADSVLFHPNPRSMARLVAGEPA